MRQGKLQFVLAGKLQSLVSLLKVVTREGHLHYVQEGKLHNEEHQEGYLLWFVNLEERLHIKQMGTKFGWANLQILNSSDYQG